MVEQLTHEAIKTKTAKLELWALDPEQKYLRREFTFSNFVEAFAFMTKIALLAEKMDHHPNWENVYSRVIINLSTHSVGGLSQLDFDLAKKIDRACSN